MLLFQNDVFVFSKTNVKMKIPASIVSICSSTYFVVKVMASSGSRLQPLLTETAGVQEQIITTPVLSSGCNNNSF